MCFISLALLISPPIFYCKLKVYKKLNTCRCHTLGFSNSQLKINFSSSSPRHSVIATENRIRYHVTSSGQWTQLGSCVHQRDLLYFLSVYWLDVTRVTLMPKTKLNWVLESSFKWKPPCGITRARTYALDPAWVREPTKKCGLGCYISTHPSPSW